MTLLSGILEYRHCHGGLFVIGLLLLIVSGPTGAGAVELADFSRPNEGFFGAVSVDGSGPWWIPFRASQGLSYDDLLCTTDPPEELEQCPAGSPYRHATGAEVCALLAGGGLAPDPCPQEPEEGPLEVDGGTAALLGWLLATTPGDTDSGSDDDCSFTRANAIFASDDPGPKGLAELEYEVCTGTGSVSVRKNLIGSGYQNAETAHFLVTDDVPDDPVWPDLPQSASFSTKSPCELGAIPYSGGVTFRVWAPNADEVAVVDTGTLGPTPYLYNASELGFTTKLVLEEGEADSCWEGEPDGVRPDGVWSADVESVGEGSEYRYLTDVLFYDSLWLPRDPRSFQVTTSDLGGSSVVYDHSSFDWEEDSYAAPPINEWVMYRLNVKTFDEDASDGSEGDLPSVLGRLSHLKEDLGVNAVMLSPVHEFPSRDDPTVFRGHRGNGFAPTDLFAVESGFGGPDALKTLVREFHENDIAVNIDLEYVVNAGYHSTMTFDGWHSDDFPRGIYFQRNEIPGKGGLNGLDFSKPPVLDFLLDNLTMWLDDYRVDGMRLDSAEWLLKRTGGVDVPDGERFVTEMNELIHSRGAYSFPEVIAWFYDGSDMQENFEFDQYWMGGVSHAVDPEGMLVKWPVAWPTWTAIELRNRDAAGPARLEFRITEQGNTPFSRLVYAGYILDTHKVSMMIHCAHTTPEGRQDFFACVTGPAPELFEPEVRRLAGLAGLFMLTVPQVPWILHGEELLRSDSMDWSLLDRYPGHLRLYRDMIALRKGGRGRTRGLTSEHVDFYRGPGANGGAAQILAYRRGDDELGEGGDDVVVLVNTSADPVTEPVGMPRPGRWRVRLNTDEAAYGEVCDGVCSWDGFGEVSVPATLAASELETGDGMDHGVEVTMQGFSALVLSCDKVDEGTCQLRRRRRGHGGELVGRSQRGAQPGPARHQPGGVRKPLRPRHRR